MSYADDIRSEIFLLKPSKRQNYPSFCYGLFLMGGRFDEQSIVLTTEPLTVSKLYGFAIRDCCGVRAAFTEQNMPLGKKQFTVALTDPIAISDIMSRLGHRAGVVNRTLMEGEAVKSFVAGAFLACGTVSEPTSGYHLEFVPPSDEMADLLFEVLSTIGYPPKSLTRRASTVLYYKESEQIEDLLTMMGAVKSSLYLMELKIYKDLRNRANRATNCETANIDKLVRASSRQLEDIELIMSHSTSRQMPANLRITAEARMQHPDASLNELAELLGISRSGVNHRLRKLGELADQIRKGEV